MGEGPPVGRRHEDIGEDNRRHRRVTPRQKDRLRHASSNLLPLAAKNGAILSNLPSTDLGMIGRSGRCFCSSENWQAAVEGLQRDSAISWRGDLQRSQRARIFQWLTVEPTFCHISEYVAIHNRVTVSDAATCIQ